MPILSQKLKKTVPLLLSRPSLLAHTIYQAISFDASMIEEGFHLGGTSALKSGTDAAKWDGIGEVILGNPEWFEAWLTAEKKCTSLINSVSRPNTLGAQLRRISITMSSMPLMPGSSLKKKMMLHSHTMSKLLIPQDELDRSWTKSQVKFSVGYFIHDPDILVDRFSPLPHVLQRTFFLTSIQLPLLEAYRLRISSSLEAFETSSSAFVRAVPGALAVSLTRREDATHDESQRLTSGVEGVQRLCKALLSAAYIEASLQDWAQELVSLLFLGWPTYLSFALPIVFLGAVGGHMSQFAFAQPLRVQPAFTECKSTWCR